jgi:hypothetical protein
VIKVASRRAAVVLAGSALALAGGLVPAQAATSGWRIDATYAIRGSSNLLTDVAAVSPSDAWATGIVGKNSGSSLQTLIEHWTGKAWRPVTLPAKIARKWAQQDTILPALGAVSASKIWVFGGFEGGYLRLNGGRWSIGQLPGGGSATSGGLVLIDAVKVFSSNNVWAFGEWSSPSSTLETSAPYAAHYTGRKWVQVPVPGSGTITAVAAASSNGMWAIEGGLSYFGTSISSGPTPPVVIHWTPSAGWQDDASQQPPLMASDQLSSVVAEPNGDVWFGGSAHNKKKGTTPLAAEWNGSAWSVKDLPTRATSADWDLDAMTPDGSGGIWALAQASSGQTAQIWRLHRGSWSRVSPAFGKRRWTLFALALVPHTRSVWAVGAVLIGKASSGTADGLIAVDGSPSR